MLRGEKELSAFCPHDAIEDTVVVSVTCGIDLVGKGGTLDTKNNNLDNNNLEFLKDSLDILHFLKFQVLTKDWIFL